METEMLTLAATAERLKAAEDILLLMHQFPDGDTIGSAAGLCIALRSLGKRARLACNDPIPEKYRFMTAAIPVQDFEPQFICAVDVADEKLLGPSMQQYAGRVDLCIDHHGTNVAYAKATLLDATAAAAAMIICQLLEPLGVALSPAIAQCLYTGMATDTGCFKYSNTSALTHRLAAACMDCGIPYAQINRTIFDIKSRARIELERLALQAITFHYHGRCAVMAITNDMIEKSKAGENDLEGLPPIPRQIEGVWVGVTLRQKADGSYKISLRTGTHANAAEICRVLGGGGHPAAAGCTVNLPLSEAIDKIVAVIGDTVDGIRD